MIEELDNDGRQKVGRWRMKEDMVSPSLEGHEEGAKTPRRCQEKILRSPLQAEFQFCVSTLICVNVK